MVTSLPVRLGLRLGQNTTCTAARSFSTSVSRCSATSQALIAKSQPNLASRTTSKHTPTGLSSSTRTQTRHASTTLANSSEATTPTPSSTTLDWNTFFRLRTTRRYYSLTSSLTGLIASTAGTFYFLTAFPDGADYVVKLIPMDPIISTGIAMTAAMATGWLVGPIFGNTLWRLLYRKRLPEFTIKERAFFERVKKHRVNPAGASTNNPVPDFYGEKIGSVGGYRRWLKDQRAFNRKRGGSFVGGV